MKEVTALELAEQMFPGDGMVPAVADAIERNDVALGVYRKMWPWFHLLKWEPKNTSHESVTKHVNNPAWWAMGIDLASRYHLPPPAAFLERAAEVSRQTLPRPKPPSKTQWESATEMSEALALIGDTSSYEVTERQSATYPYRRERQYKKWGGSWSNQKPDLWPLGDKVIPHGQKAKLAETLRRRLESDDGSGGGTKKYERLLAEAEKLFIELWS